MKNFIIGKIRKLLGVSKLNNKVSLLSSQIMENNRIINEILKAEKFHDSIIDSKWLFQKTFSPGRGAVDYAVLYTIYKTLDLMHPKNILEFGLGQSSRIIQQYANAFVDVEAVTVEHDMSWVDFFKISNSIQYDMNIKMLDLDDTIYKSQRVLMYKNLDELKNKKYDFVFVDGPFGTLGYYYSRPQLIFLIESLAEEFCVIYDDYERDGEKNTVEDFCSILKDKRIDYSTNIFRGEKDHIVICTPKYKFITAI